MRGYLLVSESDRRFVLPLKKVETQIGRDPRCDLVVEDKRTSRRHCVILRVGDGKYILRDLESKGGTFLNGERIKEKPLAWGDRIKIADLDAIFVLGDLKGESPKAEPKAANRTSGINVSDLDLNRVANPRPHHLAALHQTCLLLTGPPQENLTEALLDIILRLFRASRAGLLVFDATDPDRIRKTTVRVALEEFSSTLNLDPDHLKLVRTTGRAFLRDEDFSSIYVPIFLENSVTGVLYLDMYQQDARLTEEDVLTVAAIGQAVSKFLGTGEAESKRPSESSSGL